MAKTSTDEILDRYTVIPDEEGLLEGFRNDGHTIPDCLAELIDNALDAKGTDVKIKQVLSQISPNSKKNKIHKLIIGDNGKGVVDYKLIEALTIGKRKDEAAHIGRFGMGLKTSAFSLGRTVELLTKTLAGELVVFKWDLDAHNRKKFEVVRVRTTPEHEKTFKAYAGSTGTVVIISSIHPEVSKRLAANGKQKVDLHKELGTIYHKKIEKKALNLSIDEKKVKAQSLFKNIVKTRVDEVLSCESGIRVRFHQIDEDSASEASRGAYVYLNDRLLNLSPIQDRRFGFDHATFNHLRLELCASSWEAISQDKGFKVNNQKNGLQISGKIQEEIIKLIEKPRKDYLREIGREDTPSLTTATPTARDGSKLNKSWKKLDEKLGGLKEGMTMKMSKQKDILSAFSPAEYESQPRLLNKNDSFKALPKILQEKKLVPISISNDEIKLVCSDSVFIKIPACKKTAEEFSIGQQGSFELASLKLSDITSEKKALNFCYHHGLLAKAFGEKNMVRTVEGSERTHKLQIKLGEEVQDFSGVQIETDAGYEGEALHLVEAKAIEGDGSIEDINFRQVVLSFAHYSPKLYASKVEVKGWVFIWYKKESVARILPLSINLVSGEYKALGTEEKVYKFVP